MRINILFLIIVLLSGSISVARSQQLEWSEEKSRKIYDNTYYHQTEGNFFTVGLSNASIVPIWGIEHYTDFLPDARESIKSKINGINGSITGTCMLKDELFVFISVRKGDSYHLYAQKYNVMCLPDGEPKEIANYSTIGQSFGPSVSPVDLAKSTFRVHTSENKKFVSVFYEIPEAGEGKQRFGSKILDESLSVISEGDYTSEYSGKDIFFANYYLSNSGKFYLGAKIYLKRALSDYIFYRCDNDKAIALSALSGIKSVSEETLIYDRFTIGEDINGSLGVIYIVEDNETKNECMYFIQQDFENQEVIMNSFLQLPDNLQQTKKGDIDASQVLRWEFTLDGGVVILMKGLDNSNIAMLKLNSDNTLGWFKEIPRNYPSTFHGIAMCLQNNSICLLFNDKTAAYEESGSYEGKLVVAEYEPRTDCLVSLKFNVDDCSIIERHILSKYEKKGFACDPNEFAWDKDISQVLLVARYKLDEKYALMKFEN